MTREIENIIRTLPEQDWWTRRKSIASLLEYPEQEYVAYLEEGIRNHENANIRNTAMEIYKELGTRALSSLSLLAGDVDPEVRLFTANVLCGIRDEQSLPLLFALIKDADVNVRIASAEAFGKIGYSQALDVLAAALEDTTWVGMAAVHSMGEIGGDRALRLLHDCLQREKYREITIKVLEEVGTQDTIRHLTAFLDKTPLRELALAAIIKIAEREGVRPHPEYFQYIIPLLIEMTGSSDPDIKRQAFIALSWAEDLRALPSFLEALKDEDLQEYAIEGILSIGKKAVCIIIDELKTSVGRHRVILAKLLVMLDEPSALLQFAGDEDPEVRVEVALAIGPLGLERVVQTLTLMLSDPSDEVRIAARKGLARMEHG